MAADRIHVGDYLAKVAAARPAINVGTFIGHGSVRAAVVGQADRPATADELQQMKALVRTGMREGALGLSTGLFYVPGSYAPLQEVIELAAVAGELGGIHQSHMRDETGRVVDSVRDTIAIGEQGHLPTQVTHHKIIGKANWGRSVETLRLIDEARARGVDATLDQYPYTASSTSIQGGLLPAWAQEGGRQKMLERLRDETQLRRVLTAVTSAIENDRGGGDPANIVLAACGFDPGLAGKNLAQVLRERGRPATPDQAADLVVEIVQKGGCSAVYHAISEDDLVRIMKHPATMIASDAAPGIPTFGKDVPHPRAYGTFARVLGVYVREKKVLTLEDAVRKMSSFPARRMGMSDRGIVRPGLKADLVVFDANTIVDKATFEKPHQYAEGVAAVVVNGTVTFEGGAMTGARAGRVLRRH
ncbi:MAG: amidohydrolase family protein [Vicinamibacterales bacterium]